MTTRSFKRGAVWRIDIKKKGDFRQKVWAVLAFGDFLPKKKTGWMGSLVYVVVENRY